MAIVEKTISIEYFAILKEQRGQAREHIVTTAETPRELYAELRSRHRFSLGCEALSVAINEEFASWDTNLKANDRVALLPPAAGG